ncbi:MAG: Rieske (2Fe-2S) protein [Phycisphaerae bacterium]|nr:Rieske (2Fe-2S) protein [Phycisphaerae bacterium]
MSDRTPSQCPIDRKSAAPSRRVFFSTCLMVAGVVAGYGVGLWNFLQYLVPLRRHTPRREMFVGTLNDLKVGSSIMVKDPRGEEIALARISDDRNNPAAGFKALSSKCPHLGCRVHWDAGRGEFLCPCHNGVFDRNGVAVSGPPAKEKKNLSTFEVRVNRENGWVSIMVTGKGDYGV